jgi:hypothetical protein
MKLKKLLGLVVLLAIFAQTGFAQSDVEKNINDALTSLKAKNYKEVHASLQQAIADLGMLIGQEALTILPTDNNGFKYKKDEDNVTSNNMGMAAGTSIVRAYQGASDEKTIKINIVTNSPVIGSLSSFFSLPFASMSTAGNGQKSVKVGSQRGLLKYEKEEGTGELQIILGQTLITINSDGKIPEADLLKFAEKIDYAKLNTLLN